MTLPRLFHQVLCRPRFHRLEQLLHSLQSVLDSAWTGQDPHTRPNFVKNMPMPYINIFLNLQKAGCELLALDSVSSINILLAISTTFMLGRTSVGKLVFDTIQVLGTISLAKPSLKRFALFCVQSQPVFRLDLHLL